MKIFEKKQVLPFHLRTRASTQVTRSFKMAAFTYCHDCKYFDKICLENDFSSVSKEHLALRRFSFISSTYSVFIVQELTKCFVQVSHSLNVNAK